MSRPTCRFDPVVSVVRRSANDVSPRGPGVDTFDMIRSELELLPGDNWKTLLGAYLEAHEKAVQSSKDFDGWLPRLSVVSGLANDELSKLHGQLIAVGLLRFRLADRTAGVYYQVDTRTRELAFGTGLTASLDAWDADAETDDRTWPRDEATQVESSSEAA